MNNLKRALASTGGRDGLSITIPASYWYLQHFDIVKLADTVDWFNIMTYDLHGYVISILHPDKHKRDLKAITDMISDLGTLETNG